MGGAYLEEAEVFMPRVRRAAACLKANRAGQIFFLSDAAGAELYARDEAKGRRWAERWGRRLREDGGRVVLHYLKRTRLRSRRRVSLEAELGKGAC